jgi:erythritol transport system substrate-binding protein
MPAQIVSNNYHGATIGAEKFVELMSDKGSYVELVTRENADQFGLFGRK